jgi:hypothetical protein
MKLAIYLRNGDLEEPPAKISFDHLALVIRKKECRLWRTVAWAAFGSGQCMKATMHYTSEPENDKRQTSY